MRSRLLLFGAVLLVGAGVLWLRRPKAPPRLGQDLARPEAGLEADSLPLVHDPQLPPGPHRDPFAGIPRRKVEIGGELRNALLLSPTSRFSVKTLVPHWALLRFGAGVLRAKGDLRRPGVTFTVRVITEEGSHRTLFSRLLDPWYSERDRGWADALVILLPYSGQTVTLEFETALSTDPRAGPASAPEYAAWSHPRLETSQERPGPNVVLVSLDTLRADRLGCHGYERPTSPSLDRLAASGVRFDRAYAQAPWTTPSHVSMLTGLYPSRHGVNEPFPLVVDHLAAKGRVRVVPAGLPSLATRLRAAGYATAAFTGGATVSARLGFARGFDRYSEDFGAVGSLEVAKLRQWIDAHGLQPFFLFVHTFEVHAPYTHDDFLQLPEARRDGLRGLLAAGPAQDVVEFGHRLASLGLASVGVTSALYDGDVRSADRFLGGLVELLADLGLLDSTVLVVTSDHGEEFGDHDPERIYNSHGNTMYEEMLHVPLIVRFPPRVPAGTVIDQPVRSIDILPTLLDLAGLPAPEDVDGRSLTALWEGEEAGSRAPPVLSEASTSAAELKSLRRDRYKYIALTNGPSGSDNALVEGGDELYDLALDPRERRNVVREARDLAADMRTELQALVELARRSRPAAASSVVAEPELRERLRALGYVQ